MACIRNFLGLFLSASGLALSLPAYAQNADARSAAQKLIVDWSKVAPYTGIDGGGVYTFLTLRGTRDRGDLSYKWLAA